jgi:hypothetical protein
MRLAPTPASKKRFTRVLRYPYNNYHQLVSLKHKTQQDIKFRGMQHSTPSNAVACRGNT